MVQKMFEAFPDYNKAPAKYLLSMVSLFARYPVEIQAKMADHATGIPSKTSYLPTPADITKFIAELKAKAEQFAPAPTTYKRFQPEPSIPKSETVGRGLKKLVFDLENDPFQKKIDAQRRSLNEGEFKDEVAAMKKRWRESPIPPGAADFLMNRLYGESRAEYDARIAQEQAA